MSSKPQNNRKGRSKNFKIWQQNVNKSKTCQLDLIGSGRMVSEDIDVIALQEPYISPNKTTVAARHWITIYPTTHETDASKTRSIILICSNLISDNWEQINFHSGDVTAIRIRGNWGSLVLFNIYNDCTHNETIRALTTFHSENRDYLLGKENY